MRHWLPSKDFTDRVVPWVTFFCIVAGGVYGLAHYVYDIRDTRIQETTRFVPDYKVTPNDKEDSVRFAFEKLMGAYGGKDQAKAAARYEVRIRILDYFAIVAMCALQGTCDPDGLHFAGEYLVANYAVPSWHLAALPPVHDAGAFLHNPF